MSDYTIIVGWSGKDALADSATAKIISGDDFNTEFTAVQTAVNSKADIASETLTGTPLAPTAAAGTDTTQIATTAFVKASLTAATINALVYPVGSIYFNAEVATNPATLLGFGTWAEYGAGRVMVGKASSGTFDTLNETMGAETDAHTLTTAEIPAHTHTVHDSDHTRTPDSTDTTADEYGAYAAASGTTGSTGGGGAHTHDIVQPSIVVYMWKRTA